jgi:hypothetical protein
MYYHAFFNIFNFPALLASRYSAAKTSNISL